MQYFKGRRMKKVEKNLRIKFNIIEKRRKKNCQIE